MFVNNALLPDNAHLSIFSLIVLFLTGIEGICYGSKHQNVFKCSNNACFRGSYSSDLICFRNGTKCEYEVKWGSAGNKDTIPQSWVFDGIIDCNDGSDEKNDVERVDGSIEARKRLTEWFLIRKRNNTLTENWGRELPRTAVALYLENSSLFNVDNEVGDLIRAELSLQLFLKMAKRKNLSSGELALFINAMLVSCIDPRDFYGRNLVLELRKMVERNKYSNIMAIIALCNAKDEISQSDVDKILSTANCSSSHPACTDSHSLLIMAMSCLKSLPNITIDNEGIEYLISILAQQQPSNGTVVDTQTTALVIQAMIAAENYGSPPFNLKAAVEMIVNQQKPDGSYKNFLEAYYILPVLSFKSLISIKSNHCKKITEKQSEKEIFLKYNPLQVQCSIYVDDDLNATRSWNLNLPRNISFYGVIDVLNKRLDYKYRVKYNVWNGMPYIREVFQFKADPDQGFYWFIYKRSIGSSIKPQLLELSPADLKVNDQDEFILWYKMRGDESDSDTTSTETANVTNDVKENVTDINTYFTRISNETLFNGTWVNEILNISLKKGKGK